MREDRRDAWRARMASGWSERVVIVVAEEAGDILALAGILGGIDARLGSLIDNLHVRADRTRTGLGRRVLAAALDRLAPADADAPLHLTVYDDNVVEGRREAIRPGMRVSAEIMTGQRRVLEYLFSPIVQAVQEARRER